MRLAILVSILSLFSCKENDNNEGSLQNTQIPSTADDIASDDISSELDGLVQEGKISVQEINRIENPEEYQNLVKDYGEEPETGVFTLFTEDVGEPLGLVNGAGGPTRPKVRFNPETESANRPPSEFKADAVPQKSILKARSPATQAKGEASGGAENQELTEAELNEHLGGTRIKELGKYVWGQEGNIDFVSDGSGVRTTVGKLKKSDSKELTAAELNEHLGGMRIRGLGKYVWGQDGNIDFVSDGSGVRTTVGKSKKAGGPAVGSEISRDEVSALVGSLIRTPGKYTNGPNGQIVFTADSDRKPVIVGSRLTKNARPGSPVNPSDFQSQGLAKYKGTGGRFVYGPSQRINRVLENSGLGLVFDPWLPLKRYNRFVTTTNKFGQKVWVTYLRR